MYTPKTSNHSPYQINRAQRDISPSYKQVNKHKTLYSYQDVNKLIKAYIEPRLLYLKEQVQQKQRIISILNQKLDQNDSKLIKLNNYIQNILRRQKQMNEFQNQSHPQTIQIINQIINDKIKQYWQTINSQISKIKIQFQQKLQMDQQKNQYRVKQQIQTIKKGISQYIDQSRQKNNNYWLKIKQVLNKLNSKITAVDQNTFHLNQQLNDFKNINTKQFQLIPQIQKSKDVIKKLIQLKKSVKNIYENYQKVLELQNKFRNNVENMNKNNNNIGNFNYSSNNKNQNIQLDFSNQHNNNHYPQTLIANNTSNSKFGKSTLNSNSINSPNNYMQSGNTFPMFNKKQINYTNVNIPNRENNYQYSQDIIDLQYSRDQQILPAKKTLHIVNSPSKNNQEQDLQFRNGYYIKNNMVKNKKNNYILNSSPNGNNYIANSSTSKYQNFIGSPNQLSQAFSYLNISNPKNSHSHSNSFINLSLDHRRQMTQSIKQRLQQLIQLKNLSKPLIVYVDQINYLKNLQGNYIFDIKGNMFKINKQDAKKLQQIGLLKFVDKDKQKRHSSVNSSLVKSKIKQNFI